MPRMGITAYDLLISCPGDVNQFIDVIRECVEGFNRILGKENNVEIVPKHWLTDSYPQSGDKPQELLNKQFVRDCDAAIAILWTKFVTPTDKYGSGTEEEIEEMDLEKLVEALNNLLRKNKNTITSINMDEIQKEEYTLDESMEKIKIKLEEEEEIKFSNLFDKSSNKKEIVTIFLSILELIRLKYITIMQENNFSEIIINKRG